MPIHICVTFFKDDKCTGSGDGICTDPHFIDYKDGAGGNVDLPSDANYTVKLQNKYSANLSEVKFNIQGFLDRECNPFRRW